MEIKYCDGYVAMNMLKGSVASMEWSNGLYPNPKKEAMLKRNKTAARVLVILLAIATTVFYGSVLHSVIPSIGSQANLNALFSFMVALLIVVISSVVLWAISNNEYEGGILWLVIANPLMYIVEKTTGLFSKLAGETYSLHGLHYSRDIYRNDLYVEKVDWETVEIDPKFEIEVDAENDEVKNVRFFVHPDLNPSVYLGTASIDMLRRYYSQEYIPDGSGLQEQMEFFVFLKERFIANVEAKKREVSKAGIYTVQV